ncbi:MAG: alpha/beta hydrolase, partial [Pirellulaceae bacterium]|nr:alpha/beta hydrolase [Pirellulaceae bacterium]
MDCRAAVNCFPEYPMAHLCPVVTRTLLLIVLVTATERPATHAQVAASRGQEPASLVQRPEQQVAAAPVASAASPRSAVNVRCDANLRYSDSPGNAGLCDVYYPESHAGPGGRPAVVVVHGGGWVSGSKWVLQGYSRLLAQHGFVVVTINYRLAPQFQFPAQVDDVRQALIWTVDNAKRFSIDTDRLGIFGYSAGGHLSTLVSVLADEPVLTQMSASGWQADDPRWKRLPKVSAVCAGGPPCDFRNLPLDNSALAFFLGGSRREKPDVYAAASPISHV